MANNTVTLVCPYCDKQQIAEVSENATTKDLEDYAVKLCDCDKAKHEKRKESVKDKINLMFGDGSEANGFEEPLEKESIEALKGLCANVLDGTYINATVTFATGDKARVTTVKDRVKIVRESKNHAETKI